MRAKLICSGQRRFQMMFGLGQIFTLQADHAGHPCAVTQIAGILQEAEGRRLIALVQRAQSIDERLFFGRCHQPPEKSKAEFVSRGRSGSCGRGFAVLNCVEQTCARNAHRAAIAARADGVLRPAGPEG